MKKEIMHIDGRQSAKIIAITMFFVMLIFSAAGLIVMIAGLAGGSSETVYMGLAYLVLPVFYFIIVYLLTRLYFWIFNKCALRWGGLVFDMKDAGENRG